MSKHTLYLIVLMLGLSACNTYSPIEEPSGSAPIFTFQGKFNGTEVSFAADGVVAIAASASDLDSLNVLVHEGFLHTPTDKTERIIDVQFRSLSNSNLSIGAVLNQPQIPVRFISGLDSTLFYNISLSGDYIGNPSSVTWTVNGQSYSGISVDFKVKANESITKLPIHIAADFDNGCQSNFTDTIYLPNHQCDGVVSTMQVDPTTFEYTVEPTGGTGFKYFWEFQDGSAASSQTVKRFYPAPLADKEIAILRLENENAVAFKRFALDLSGSANCDVNMLYDIVPSYEYNATGAAEDYGQVVINYFENGMHYSSENGMQPDDGSFEMVEYKEYSEASAPDQAFLKVKMKFSGLLSNGSDSIAVEDLEIILPFEL